MDLFISGEHLKVNRDDYKLLLSKEQWKRKLWVSNVLCLCSVVSLESYSRETWRLHGQPLSLTPLPFFLLLITHTMCFPLASPKHCPFSHVSCSHCSQSLGRKLNIQLPNVRAGAGLWVHKTNSLLYRNMDAHEVSLVAKPQSRSMFKFRRHFLKACFTLGLLNIVLSNPISPFYYRSSHLSWLRIGFLASFVVWSVARPSFCPFPWPVRSSPLGVMSLS